MKPQECQEYRDMLLELERRLLSKRAPKSVVARVHDVMLAVDWLEGKK